MSTAKTETMKNLKTDADWYTIEIRPQMLSAMITLKEADEYQAIIQSVLSKSTAVHAPASELADYVKAMLKQTRDLKTQAALIHENTRKLDHTLTQLEALEKEGNQCETR